MIHLMLKYIPYRISLNKVIIISNQATVYPEHVRSYLLEQLLKSFLILCCVTSVSSLEELSNEAIFFSTKYSILMNGYIDGISPEKVFSNFLSLWFDLNSCLSWSNWWIHKRIQIYSNSLHCVLFSQNSF